MNARREGLWFALFTVGWTLVWCADVAQAWRHSPYDRLGWAAAAGWAAWVVVSGRRRNAAGGWLAAAWLVSFAGVAGELNVLQHAGLALAGAAWAGGGRRGLAVLVLAAGWTPATGWALRGCGQEAVMIFRLLAGLGTGVLAWREWRRP